MTQVTQYWNHNVHYQPVITGAVPARCRTALDVGCGDGMLACQLAERCGIVTGIDSDPRMIELARERAGADGGGAAVANVTFVLDDFLKYRFQEASFDFVCANTVVHHMGTAEAFRKMASILRPGGRLAVVGLGAYGSRTEYLPDLAAIPLNRYYQRTLGEGDPGCPKREPDLTWAQVREIARRVLPGARYRRHLLWRYSVIWDKPA
jgi:SAM-dependent methyltransferase